MSRAALEAEAATPPTADDAAFAVSTTRFFIPSTVGIQLDSPDFFAGAIAVSSATTGFVSVFAAFPENQLGAAPAETASGFARTVFCGSWIGTGSSPKSG